MTESLILCLRMHILHSSAHDTALSEAPVASLIKNSGHLIDDASKTQDFSSLD